MKAVEETIPTTHDRMSLYALEPFVKVASAWHYNAPRESVTLTIKGHDYLLNIQTPHEGSTGIIETLLNSNPSIQDISLKGIINGGRRACSPIEELCKALKENILETNSEDKYRFQSLSLIDSQLHSSDLIALFTSLVPYTTVTSLTIRGVNAEAVETEKVLKALLKLLETNTSIQSLTWNEPSFEAESKLQPVLEKINNLLSDRSFVKVPGTASESPAQTLGDEADFEMVDEPPSTLEIVDPSDVAPQPSWRERVVSRLGAVCRTK